MAFPALDGLTNHTLKWAVLADDITGVSDGGAITTQWVDQVESEASAVENGSPQYTANVLNGHAGVYFDRDADALGESLGWPLTQFDDYLMIVAGVWEDEGAVNQLGICVCDPTDNDSRVIFKHRSAAADLYEVFEELGGDETVRANSSSPAYGTLDVHGVGFRNGTFEWYYKDGTYGNQEGDATVSATATAFDHVYVGSEPHDNNGMTGNLLFAAVWQRDTDANDAEIASLMQAIEDYFNSVPTGEIEIGFQAFVESLGPPGQQAAGVNFNAFLRDAGVGDDTVKKLGGRHAGKVVP